MTAELGTAANDNLTATYRAIGASGPEPEFMEQAGVLAVKSPLRHPLSNFAILSRIEESSLLHLRTWIEPREVYNVYTFAQIGESPPEHVLSRAGFRHSSMLTTMASASEESSDVELLFAEAVPDRFEASKFIADQFFPRQSPEIKSVITLATSGSGIPLAWLRLRGKTIGALMLHDVCGVLGIYNFCIEESLRGQGLGRQSLRSIVQYAHRKNQRTVLQCEPKLVGWYESCGYEGIAHVDVWTLDIPKDRVIMEKG